MKRRLYRHHEYDEDCIFIISMMKRTLYRHHQCDDGWVCLVRMMKRLYGVYPRAIMRLEKTHICSTCRRPFNSSTHLKSHEATHLPPVWPRPHCDKVFTRRENLQDHCLACHPAPGEVPISCPECGTIFTKPRDRDLHVTVAHRNGEGLMRHQCQHEGCDYWTYRRGNLTRHQKKHSSTPGAEGYTCGCGLTFQTHFELEKHAGTHLEPEDDSLEEGGQIEEEVSEVVWLYLEACHVADKINGTALE